MSGEKDKGIPIRSLSRGIAVLQAINRSGSATITELSRACDLPFPTVSRLLHSLMHEGLIEREPNRRRFRPTALVQTLAHGFQGDSRLVKTARPHIVELTRSVGWPITLSTHVGHSMVIRDSTHSLSALTFNEYFPGYATPLLESASGLAWIAAMADDAREGLLTSIALLDNAEWEPALHLLRETDLLEQINTQGYAARSFNRFTRNPGKTSSIATVVMDGDRPLGTISLAYFASAMKPEEAIDRFAGPVCSVAKAIGVDLLAEEA